jgi:SAM-dependent methyltransferase
MDIREHNRRAWDGQVAKGNRWTVPVSSATIASARRGEWEVLLTPTKPVPRAWFPPLAGLDVLGLASGGGQQGPLLAAAGARVTVLDNSPRQLEQDRMVADRDGLTLRTVEGGMADLHPFADASFDLVFHPCSNSFVPDVRPVWREAFRVLRRGGAMLAGFVNPVAYAFDDEPGRAGEFTLRYQLPYSDLTSLGAAACERLIASGEPLSFSHSLEEQIGGQLEAGFVLTGLFEDAWADELLSAYFPLCVATRALKP